MASDDELNKNIENLKNNVRKSFARLYASLKARELKTLRQLDVIRKQCEEDEDLSRNCVQNIHISYENESKLLENVNNFGVIDFERLNFDSNIFTLEDFVSPNDDHMYNYKTIEELAKENNDDLKAIEEAAIKEVTKNDNCVCNVSICSEDVSKKFRDLDPCQMTVKSPCKKEESLEVSNEEKSEVLLDDDISDSSEEVKKIDPTDEWLNSIKNQTETEPTQASDVMEHSTITCS